MVWIIVFQTFWWRSCIETQALSFGKNRSTLCSGWSRSGFEGCKLAPYTHYYSTMCKYVVPFIPLMKSFVNSLN